MWQNGVLLLSISSNLSTINVPRSSYKSKINRNGNDIVPAINNIDRYLSFLPVKIIRVNIIKIKLQAQIKAIILIGSFVKPIVAAAKTIIIIGNIRSSVFKCFFN
jgi:hypothetical protein